MTDEPSNCLTILQTVSTLVQMGAVIFASYVAYKGINAWQKENVGKRKQEIAEESLANFYRFQHIMGSIRSPLGFEGEAKTRIKQHDETEAQSRLLDSYYAPIERYKNHDEFFSQFQTLEYSFRAYFGDVGQGPFKKAFGAVKQFSIAAHMLVNSARPDGYGSLSSEQKNKNENLLWDYGDEDPIQLQIDEAVKDMEDLCKPVLLNR